MCGVRPSLHTLHFINCLRCFGDIRRLVSAMLESHFSWQVHHFVMLEGHSCCSVHCTGRFMFDEDRSSDSFFVASAIFGDVGG